VIDLTLVEEKEILEMCKECSNPFELSFINKEYAVEVDGGEYYLHRSCALKLSRRLERIALEKKK
jgi:hypothetical protein